MSLGNYAALPAGWATAPLKHVVSINSEVLPESTDPEAVLQYVDIAALEGGACDFAPKEVKFSEAPSRARRVLRSGDTIVSTVRTYLKAIATFPQVDGNLIASTGFAVLRPNGKLHSRYAYWATLAAPFIENVVANSTGVSYPAIAPTTLGNLPTVVPPSLAQERIANFLDDKTARIDALIAEKERLSCSLEEYRLSSINRAVSIGLSLSTALSDTDDDWFEQVPAHWAFCPLNFRYEVQLGKMLDEKRITGNFLRPYLRNTDVQWGCINVDALPQMDILPEEAPRYTVQPGDLLVCEGGDVGRAAIWAGAAGEIAFQKALHRVRPRRATDLPRFLYYALVDSAKRGRFDGRGQATIAHLTAEAFRRYRFAFPPLDEQRAIVGHLDEMCQKIDALALHCSQHIARLREYRSSLISAAVTGQLDLRTSRAIE